MKILCRYNSTSSNFHQSLLIPSLLSLFMSLTACSVTTIDTPTDSSEQAPGINTTSPMISSDRKLSIIESGSTWLYKKGLSTPVSTWITTEFNDSSWSAGTAGFGYSDNDDATVISDMSGNYLTLYVRKTFSIDDSYNLNSLILDIDYDDGFIAYINGQEVARANMPDGTPTHQTSASISHEAGTPVLFDLSSFSNILVSGKNVLAIEIHNQSLASSDLSLHPRLLLNHDTSTISNTSETNTTGSGTTSGGGTTTSGGNNLDGPGGLCADETTCGSLAGYTQTTPLTNLSYINNNLSGITYVADSDTFFMIENGGATIWEVDTSYNRIRTIKSSGFGDAEDLVYLGSNNEFAIVNEASKLYIGTIAPNTTTLNASDFQEITFDTYSGNAGAEGVAFNIETQTFYIVKEVQPRKLYSFVRPNSSENMTVTPTFPFDLQTTPSPRVGNDVSAITYDPSTGHLLILSDIDYRVVEVGLDGTVYGVLQFPFNSQFEGITLDANHVLHVVSEPNKYTVYTEQ